MFSKLTRQKSMKIQKWVQIRACPPRSGRFNRHASSSPENGFRTQAAWPWSSFFSYRDNGRRLELDGGVGVVVLIAVGRAKPDGSTTFVQWRQRIGYVQSGSSWEILLGWWSDGGAAGRKCVLQIRMFFFSWLLSHVPWGAYTFRTEARPFLVNFIDFLDGLCPLYGATIMFLFSTRTMEGVCLGCAGDVFNNCR